MTADDITQGHSLESADTQGLEGLCSARSNHRLNQIEQVRANGVGDHIYVCHSSWSAEISLPGRVLFWKVLLEFHSHEGRPRARRWSVELETLP